MTRAEIRAELRRSACEDRNPYMGCHDDAFCVAHLMRVPIYDRIVQAKPLQIRVFYLIVAEAM